MQLSERGENTSKVAITPGKVHKKRDTSMSPSNWSQSKTPPKEPNLSPPCISDTLGAYRTAQVTPGK